MYWGMEPSTRPAKRSKSKRLSSDYISDKRLWQATIKRLWDAYRLIASRKTSRKIESKTRSEMRPECGSPPGGFFCGGWAVPRRVLMQSARRHGAHGAAERARRAQDARKRTDPIGCMQSIKAAQNALQRYCGRCGIFCRYSRNGAGMPTARENGRRRGERVPGVHPDGRAALRDAGRLLGRSGAACRDRA